MKKLQTLLLASAAAVIVASVSTGAGAVVLIERDFDGGIDGVPTSGNDCKGYFGDSFDACTIFVNDDGQRIELSPVIAKIDEDDGSWEVNNTEYPTIDANGGEFSYTGGGTGSGTWTYTPDDPEDPGVRYWVAKDSTQFRLHWYVEASAVAPGGACAVADTYTLDCLNEALVVTSGEWNSPFGGSSLSHLTWYDSEPPRMVPEPATLGLLGIGLLGAGYWARRRRDDA